MTAADKSRAAVTAERREGLAFARAWKARRHGVPAIEHMPFAGHRNCAQWTEAEAA